MEVLENGGKEHQWGWVSLNGVDCCCLIEAASPWLPHWINFTEELTEAASLWLPHCNCHTEVVLLQQPQCCLIFKSASKLCTALSDRLLTVDTSMRLPHWGCLTESASLWLPNCSCLTEALLLQLPHWGCVTTAVLFFHYKSILYRGVQIHRPFSCQ